MPRKRTSKKDKNLATIIAGYLILAMIIGGLVTYIVLNRGKGPEISSTTLTFGLKDVGKLVTQEGFYRNVQQITDSRELLGITMPFTEKKYIYSYDGVVQAGIDFEKVDVNVDHEAKVIYIYMPTPEILNIIVKPDSFYVYHETNNAFNTLKLNDVNDAQKELEDEVKKTAMDNGILEAAKTNANVLIRGLLQGMDGFADYRIVVFEKPETTKTVQPTVTEAMN